MNKSRVCSALLNSNGFTLLEMIIVMGIFMVVIMISTGAFEKIIKISSQQTKSSDSTIQGIVGLEIMRSDLEHAGFGLPWLLDFQATYDECQIGANANVVAYGIDPSDFNDINNPATNEDPNKTPRAVQSATAGGGATGGEVGRDYIVIKSSYVGMNGAAKKWSYVEGVGGASSIKQFGTTTDIITDDWVITVDALTHRLIAADKDNISYKVPALSGGKYTPLSAYQPIDASSNFLLYGIKESGNTAPPVPYNRVDYYIRRPADIPSRCASGTGVLYKSNLNYSGGGMTHYPLLDCVADMQIIYSLDTNEDGGVDLHGDEDILSLLSAAEIRKQLKEIRVYILTHEGQKDSSFTYSTQTVGVGEFGLGRDFDLATLNGIGAAWPNYRWKLYQLVVNPKNING